MKYHFEGFNFWLCVHEAAHESWVEAGAWPLDPTPCQTSGASTDAGAGPNPNTIYVAALGRGGELGTEPQVAAPCSGTPWPGLEKIAALWNVAWKGTGG